MSISVKSGLKDKDRVYVIAVDRYDTTMRGGVLYRTDKPMGIPFSDYPGLVGGLEQRFEQLKYPRANMRRRVFGDGVENRWLAVVDQEGTADSGAQAEDIQNRRGRLLTFRLRVTHRENASWQGTLSCLEKGGQESFSSFQELVLLMDGYLGGRSAQRKADQEEMQDGTVRQQRFEECLSIVMECPEQIKILPDTLVYRFARGTQRMTFLIRPVFYAHDTCQGLVFWKERRQQRSFRSLLELVGLLSDAVYNDTVWDMEELEAAK